MNPVESGKESPTEPQGKEATAQCMSCGATSHTRPLLSGLYKGEPRWVCVRCLPMLIHGGE